MLTDLPGRLNNLRLPHSKALTPLFECVINSMHAIEQAGAKPGRIDVGIRRDPQQLALGDSLPVVTGFTVTDNGIGFDSANFRSFETSDSTYKKTIGGKGIGRLLWLKAFREVRIESVFDDGIEQKKRSFMFRPSEQGIEDPNLRVADRKTPRQTTVELIQMREEYASQFPASAEVLARRLIEHLLVMFLSPGGPNLFVHDEAAGDHIDVKALYKSEIAANIAQETIKVRDHKFTCHIARLYSAEETRHRYFLCAHQRDVTAEKLQPHIPDLARKLTDDRGAFVLLVYVTGQYLDDHVNQERTAVAFAEEEGDLVGGITRSQLIEAIVGAVRTHVDPLLSTVREEKRAQIERHIATVAPEYRPLLKEKYAEILEEIPPYLPLEKLEAELHKRVFRIEQAVREKVIEIKAEKVENAEQLAELREKYIHLITEENELGKAKLAKYVVHRKTILDLFERNLSLQADGGYSLESSIHEIICPLNTVSDDVPFEKLNLWIIDERLAFHHYLASDKQIGTLEAVDAQGRKRPDLIVFNRPIAFVDSTPPFQSIVIVEFKRPMREEYKEKDPITQVYEYAQEISEGRARDRSGRPIPVRNVPFYAYIICDITPEIQAACKKAQLLETPDGMGYFGFNSHYNCYIEVISFSKVLENSKRRNRVFFEQLGLPATG